MNSTEKIVDQLNNLLILNYDSENGWEKAISNTENSALQSFFKVKLSQRRHFKNELIKEIKAFGGTPDKGHSLVGKMHQTWMDILTALSTNDEEAVLDACETGEKAALKNYEAVLETEDLPMSTKAMLVKQKTAIEKSLRQVDALEDIYED